MWSAMAETEIDAVPEQTEMCGDEQSQVQNDMTKVMACPGKQWLGVRVMEVLMESGIDHVISMTT